MLLQLWQPISVMQILNFFCIIVLFKIVRSEFCFVCQCCIISQCYACRCISCTIIGCFGSVGGICRLAYHMLFDVIILENWCAMSVHRLWLVHCWLIIEWLWLLYEWHGSLPHGLTSTGILSFPCLSKCRYFILEQGYAFASVLAELLILQSLILQPQQLFFWPLQAQNFQLHISYHIFPSSALMIVRICEL